MLPTSKRILRGVYSSSPDYSLFSAYAMRYPNAIATLQTALSLYGMTDSYLEPPFSLAFKRGSRKTRDENINQLFISPDLFYIGVSHVRYEDRDVLIHDKERLLIEIFRFRGKIAPSFYKEAISFYRSLASTGQLNIPKYKRYSEFFPNKGNLLKRLSDEVL